MAKLPASERFLDFSDYGRLGAVKLVNLLMPTKIGAITITWIFTIVGIISAVLIYLNLEFLAALLLPIKSLLDAADGEMARARNKPSYVGRYLDSVNDFIINALLIFIIAFVYEQSFWWAFLALILMELQGSIFNYYYLVKRYQCEGDKTSRIDESEVPIAYPWDNKTALKILHLLYLIIYRWQDKIIFLLDKEAVNSERLPRKFMSLVSILGLGFQLLIVTLFLILGIAEYIIPFFIVPYTIFGICVILIRKYFIK